MKILHIAPIGHHAEGIGTVLQKLVPLQNKLGNDVRIVSVYNNVTYTNLPITTIKDKRTFRLFVEEWRPDVVQFHSLYQMEYIPFSHVLQSKNIPYVAQMHGALSEVNYKKNHWKKYIANLIWWNKFLRNAKTIIYLNEAEYKKCVVKKINPKATFLPNGCEIHSNANLNRLVNDTLDIVFIGRIAYTHKGLDILLEAVRQLEAQNATGFHITIYGNEDDIDVTRLKNDTANLRLISYAGSVYRERKREVLSSSDLFILTSRYEGMSMGVLEALSYGVPCILTPGTNMADDVLAAGAGWKTDLNAQAIADTVIQTLADLKSNHFKYNQAAYNMSKRYDWKVIAKESIILMAQIMKK